MESIPRGQRIGAGLLLGSFLVAFGAMTGAHREVVPAIVLAAVALMGLGAGFGTASPVGRPMLSLGLVSLLHLGLVGSVAVHWGVAAVAFVVFIPVSIAIGFLLPTRWIPTCAAIAPVAGALMFDVGPAAFSATLIASVYASLLSYVGVDIRRHRRNTHPTQVGIPRHAARW